MSIHQFIKHHYRHFNAAELAAALHAYVEHVSGGGKMMITLAGAMSTAELGVSLAELIRCGGVDAICCTGANLEEDIFNLVAHEHYQRIPHWRNLTPQEEKQLESQGLNRVTDTCIPEEEAFRAIEGEILALWQDADRAEQRYFPHEYLYQLLNSGRLAPKFQIDSRDSWLVAACERNLPLFVPGWEDSTLGNIFAAHVLMGNLSGYHLVRSGTEYMGELASWYMQTTMGASLADRIADGTDNGEPSTRIIPPQQADCTIGFFQIGGGIAGDFPICVVPMLHQDLRVGCPYWGYFCQISDSTTSYGSYSGAFPTEKITWGKLDIDTPKFLIESDATIVAPLLFCAIVEELS